jgi:hypothetical protein
MQKALVTSTRVLTSTAAVAMESYGGGKHDMSFALGGYSAPEDLDDEGYQSGADFRFKHVNALKNYAGFGGVLAVFWGFAF